MAPEGLGGVDEEGALAHGGVLGKEAAEGFGGGGDGVGLEEDAVGGAGLGGGFGGGRGGAGAGELLGGDVPGFAGDGGHDVEGENHRDGVDDHVRRDGLDAQGVADEGHDDDDLEVARRDHRHEGQEGEGDEEENQQEWVGLEHGMG